MTKKEYLEVELAKAWGQAKGSLLTLMELRGAHSSESSEGFDKFARLQELLTEFISTVESEELYML